MAGLAGHRSVSIASIVSHSITTMVARRTIAVLSAIREFAVVGPFLAKINVKPGVFYVVVIHVEIPLGTPQTFRVGRTIRVARTGPPTIVVDARGVVHAL